MTVQKLAADLCQRDIGRTIECTDWESGLSRTGALHSMINIYGAIGLTLIDANEVWDIDLVASDVVEVTGSTPPIGPDCLHGKHPACAGRVLDPASDVVVACTCHCHTQEEPA